MKTTDLDSAYTQICQTMTDLGEDKARLYLARFALLAMIEIKEISTVQQLIDEASENLLAPTENNS